MTLYKPLQAVYITLATELVNEIFIYLEDITVSPGYLKEWRIFKMTAVALGPKSLSRIRIQGN